MLVGVHTQTVSLRVLPVGYEMVCPAELPKDYIQSHSCRSLMTPGEEFYIFKLNLDHDKFPWSIRPSSVVHSSGLY